jgi:hypothetical protein
MIIQKTEMYSKISHKRHILMLKYILYEAMKPFELQILYGRNIKSDNVEIFVFDFNISY